MMAPPSVLGQIVRATLVLWMLSGAAGTTAQSRAVQPEAPTRTAASAPGVVPFAVMGDSNSHSYQDTVIFPPGSRERGGKFRAQTFQWTEVLARLRPGVIDPGPWEISGQGRLAALADEWLWQRNGPRSPRKQDYRYNFAHTGSACHSLVKGARRQVQPLLAVMAQDPARWRQGVVVIRIGVVLMGQVEFLDALAKNPDAAPRAHQVMQECLGHTERAVNMIRAAHPQTHIVLVGVSDESTDPGNFERWQSRPALDNISRGLDRFDVGLRNLAARVPHTSFFDDRAMFKRLWGDRDAQGRPAFRTLSPSPLLPQVTMSVGDEPRHALVADGHWGLVMNVLWAQAMSQHLKSVGLPVAPITDGEARAFIEAQLH